MSRINAGLVSDANRIAPRMVANRRAIHANPELGIDNPDTQARIVEELRRIGVEDLRTGTKLTSVIAEIRGTGQGAGADRRVVLRADTDALPLTEHNVADWASAREGRMHACGHDAHVAMLLGAAEILSANRDAFAGSVRLFFQPGEEGYGGARLMIEEGALDGVDAAFGIHVETSREPGTVWMKPGTIMASTDEFVITFKGSGGHASMPHHAVDPIPAIGPFVDALSHAAARETDPDDRVVYSVTKVKAGTAFNVIPHEAKVGGTIRALSVKGRTLAEERLRRIAAGIAAVRGLEVEVSLHRGYPPTVNHLEPTGLVREAVAGTGLRACELPSPVMGAEDFSYVLEQVPGAFVFLGASVPDGGPLHSDKMKLDESVLPLGALLHVAAAFALLENESS
ncbi:MAG: amidohydrolase [Hyphomicrobiaceae bacterium]